VNTTVARLAAQSPRKMARQTLRIPLQRDFLEY
jgi:hypothetical protein